MKTIAQWVLLALAGTPFLLAPLTLSPALTLKNMAFVAIAMMVSLALCVLFVDSKSRGALVSQAEALSRKPLFIVMMLSMLALGISTVLAHDTYFAFFGDLGRGEGVMVLYAIYTLYIGAVLLFTKKEWRYFWGLTSVAVLIILGVVLVSVSQGKLRPSATLGNPIFLAGWSFFGLLGSWYTAQHKDIWYRVLGYGAVFASILTIFISGTRGALLGMAVASLVVIITLISSGAHVRIGAYTLRRIGILIGIAMLAFGLLFASTQSAKVWQSIPGLNRIAQGDTTTLTSRALFLKISLDGFVESTPKQQLFGWGWNNYIYFWNQNYDPSVYKYDAASADRAHNKLADVLIMSGVVGLALYLILWFFTFKAIAQVMKRQYVLGIGILFVVVSYLVHNMFAFDIPITFVFFYMMIAHLTDYHHEA